MRIGGRRLATAVAVLAVGAGGLAGLPAAAHAMHTAMLLAGSRRGWFRLAAGFLSLTGRARRPGGTGVPLRGLPGGSGQPGGDARLGQDADDGCGQGGRVARRQRCRRAASRASGSTAMSSPQSASSRELRQTGYAVTAVGHDPPSRTERHIYLRGGNTRSAGTGYQIRDADQSARNRSSPSSWVPQRCR